MVFKEKFDILENTLFLFSGEEWDAMIHTTLILATDRIQLASHKDWTLHLSGSIYGFSDPISSMQSENINIIISEIRLYLDIPYGTSGSPISIEAHLFPSEHSNTIVKSNLFAFLWVAINVTDCVKWLYDMVSYRLQAAWIGSNHNCIVSLSKDITDRDDLHPYFKDTSTASVHELTSYNCLKTPAVPRREL